MQFTKIIFPSQNCRMKRRRTARTIVVWIALLLLIASWILTFSVTVDGHPVLLRTLKRLRVISIRRRAGNKTVSVTSATTVGRGWWHSRSDDFLGSPVPPLEANLVTVYPKRGK